MKKGMVLILVMTIAGTAVFAAGQNEVPGPGTPSPGRAPAQAPELISLTGTVDFTAAGAVLTADGKKWNLLYPRELTRDMDIPRGTTITVKGFVPWFYPGADPADGTSELFLRVQTAEIAGVTYNLDGPGPYPAGWCGYGPGDHRPRHHRSMSTGGPPGRGRGW